MPFSNKDELKPENTYKTKTSPKKLTPLAPNFAEQHYTQQVKLTIELGSDDVNQNSFNMSCTLHLSACGEDDADGRIPRDGLHTPVVFIIRDVQTKDEFQTLSKYKGTLNNWQSTNNLQHKEESKCYVDQCIYNNCFQDIQFHIWTRSRQHS